MLVTVSIISHKNKGMIIPCIKSVYDTADGLDVEVIVVDNASLDGSVEAIRDAFPEVRLIVNDKVEGFSANHNKAIRAATGDYVLILNDDTVLHPGALAALAGFLHDNPRAGAAGGLLQYPDGTPQYTGKKKPTLLAALMVSLGLHRLWPDNPVTAGYYNRKQTYDTVEEVESVNGAAMMVKREVIDKAGVLDEGFFLFCEDVDWSIRIREAGYGLYFLPQARITHYRGASTGGRRIVWIYHKSLLRFYRKHYAAKNLFFVNWLVYAGIIVRFVIYYIYGGVRKKGRPDAG